VSDRQGSPVHAGQQDRDRRNPLDPSSGIYCTADEVQVRNSALPQRRCTRGPRLIPDRARIATSQLVAQLELRTLPVAAAAHPPCRRQLVRKASTPACPSQIAFAVLAFRRRLGLVLLLGAACIGANRIFVGVHYPLDVLASVWPSRSRSDGRRWSRSGRQLSRLSDPVIEAVTGLITARRHGRSTQRQRSYADTARSATAGTICSLNWNSVSIERRTGQAAATFSRRASCSALRSTPMRIVMSARRGVTPWS
jgi:hypothetical protein